MKDFDILRSHVGHDIECVIYGNVNVSIECCTCNEVLYSIDKDSDAIEED